MARKVTRIARNMSPRLQLAGGLCRDPGGRSTVCWWSRELGAGHTPALDTRTPVRIHVVWDTKASVDGRSYAGFFDAARE